MIRLSYNTARFPFRTFFEEWLGTADLEGLRDDEYHVAKGHDNHSKWHRLLYEKMPHDEVFLERYQYLIQHLVLPALGWIGTPALFQRIPCVRVSLPGSTAIGSLHSDSDFGHQREEWNLYAPVTPAFGTGTFFAESEEGRADYAPVEGSLGDLIIWRGSVLKHGNHQNTTNRARLSFDARVIKASDFQDRGLKTVSAGVEMKIGKNAYWSVLE